MSKTIRLQAFYPNPQDGTSFYRGAGVFSALRKQYRDTIDLQLVYPNEIHWASQMDVDCAFFQRPSTDLHVTAAQITKTCGIPLWLDYDDDLLNVTNDNPTAAYYGKEKNRDNLKRLLAMADVVTVSTESIKQSFAEFCKTTVVIPNAWNDTLMPFMVGSAPRTNRCVWRGSGTHIRDVMDVAPQIIEASKQSPDDWKFSFMGWDPWFVSSRCKNSEYIPKAEVIHYLHQLRQLSGKILYVPLADTRFNRSKSNIAALEATYAGMKVIAPELPEWRLPGVTNYTTAEDFGEKLVGLVASPWERLLPEVEQTKRHVKDQLLLSRINRDRMDILLRLVG